MNLFITTYIEVCYSRNTSRDEFLMRAGGNPAQICGIRFREMKVAIDLRNSFVTWTKSLCLLLSHIVDEIVIIFQRDHDRSYLYQGCDRFQRLD